MKFVTMLLFSFTVALSGLNAQSIDTKALSLEDANRIADASIAKAVAENWTVVIVVVDAGGHLILLKKIDNTQIKSVDIAIQKARTAVYYKRPTKVFQDGVAGGNIQMLGLPDMIAFEGGLPILNDGLVIGGIGVSGATPAQDGIIAAAGLEALNNKA